MTFTPTRYEIASITKANPAVLSTTSATTLTTGQVVRVLIPERCGMQQLNNVLVQVTFISTSSFSLQYSQCNPVNVDSTDFYAFASVGVGTPPQVIAVGSAPTPISSPFWAGTNGLCVSLVEDAQTNNSTSEIPF